MAKCMHWERALGFLTASQHTSLTQKDSSLPEALQLFFCFIFPVPTRLEHILAMSLEEREREKKTTRKQLPVFQLQTLLEGFVKLTIKVLQTEMFFSLYDFWKVSNFSWYCVQNQQVCTNTSGSRLTGGKSLQDPVRARDFCCVCANGRTTALASQR